MLALLAVVTVLAVGFIVLRPAGTASPDDEPEVVGNARTDFLHRDLSTNVITRYNPCQPLRYVVNQALGPPGWTLVLDKALAEVSKASGVVFQNAGPVDEEIDLDLKGQHKRFYGWPRDVEGYSKGYQKLFNRPSYQPERYGVGQWAPVLIGWAPFGDIDAGYNHEIAGLGASEPRTSNGVTSFVSGTLMLNSGVGPFDLETTIMHELGHVLGLAHVGSPDEIMHAMQRGATTWGPGDLEGLQAVGKPAGCVETPSPGA